MVVAVVDGAGSRPECGRKKRSGVCFVFFRVSFCREAAAIPTPLA